MAAFAALVLVVAGIAFVAVIVFVAVIIGVHQEERRWTLGRTAPTGSARLARRVLGACYPDAAQGGVGARIEKALRDDYQLAGTDA